jgi:hypothetical protein
VSDPNERRHVANIDIVEFYTPAFGGRVPAQLFYESVSNTGVPGKQTAKVILNQAARMIWLGDRIQEVSLGRPALPLTFCIIAAEAVAKLADGLEEEGKSRAYVRHFFSDLCTAEQRAGIHLALQWANPRPPSSPDDMADYLYSMRCDVVHEGRYFEMTVPSDLCVGEVRMVVLEGAIQAARNVAARSGA